MRHGINSVWNKHKETWFRDNEQDNSVATLILHRLADDMIQNECRYLCRLIWHFHMGYQEVSYDELVKYVSKNKMDILNKLFNCIYEKNYASIDEWISMVEKEYPLIEDKWINENKNTTYVKELFSKRDS
jgi:hypothetical protein